VSTEPSTVPTKITLELPGALRQHAETAWPAIVGVLEAEGYIWAVEQITAQLPKPLPPEPTGDALVLRHGEVFGQEREGHWKETRTGVVVDWSWICWEPFKVYRPEPSPEGVEALVRWLEGSWDEGREPIEDLAREFARRLLGGEQ
jgi:hypothetical protein